MRTKTISVDIFDTLITRDVANPTDVFLLMQQKLDRYYTDLFPHQFIKSFWGIRIWAEFMVRRQSTKEDITIHDIYSFIGENYLSGSNNNVILLINIEINCENSVVKLIDGAKVWINSFRDTYNIIFISDMYLPQNTIYMFLKKFDLIESKDMLYVSGEIAKSKHKGNLFYHVLEDLGIEPGNLIHYGDNYYSDVLQPEKIGIESYDILKRNRVKAKLSIYISKLRYLLLLIKAKIIIRNIQNAK